MSIFGTRIPVRDAKRALLRLRRLLDKAKNEDEWVDVDWESLNRFTQQVAERLIVLGVLERRSDWLVTLPHVERKIELTVIVRGMFDRAKYLANQVIPIAPECSGPGQNLNVRCLVEPSNPAIRLSTDGIALLKTMGDGQSEAIEDLFYLISDAPLERLSAAARKVFPEFVNPPRLVESQAADKKPEAIDVGPLDAKPDPDTGQQTGQPKKSFPQIPGNPKVFSLIRMRKSTDWQGYSIIAIAREICDGNEDEAQNLVRQERRFRKSN